MWRPFTPLAILAFAFVVASPAQADWHVPEKGSAERAEIMDALRTKLATFDPANHDLVFVVQELCVSDKSGWIAVEPRSRDGQGQFESVQAVLAHKSAVWSVGQIACGEEECAKGTDAEALRRKVAPQCP